MNRSPALVAALALCATVSAGCRGSTSIYRRPDIEARILNLYEERVASWPVRVESRYVPTSYGVAHLLVSGPPDAPPLLLLHAMGVTSTMWRANIAELSRARRVYCLDFLGDLGRSRLYSDAHPRDGNAVAELLAEIMDRLGVAQADVVGASYGGWAGMQLAARHPERVRRLGLLGPMGIAPVTADAVARLTSLMLLPTKEKKRDMMAWALGEDSRVRAELEEYMMVAMDAEGRLPPPLELSDAELRGIRAPALLILGEKDGPVGPPEKSTARALAAIPNLEVLVLPGVGHMMSVERAELVNARLTEFLSHSGATSMR